jgi:hypothetical protein
VGRAQCGPSGKEAKGRVRCAFQRTTTNQQRQRCVERRDAPYVLFGLTVTYFDQSYAYVMPEQSLPPRKREAGIQHQCYRGPSILDSSFRGNDGIRRYRNRECYHQDSAKWLANLAEYPPLVISRSVLDATNLEPSSIPLDCARGYLQNFGRSLAAKPLLFT